jgi:hypothetical protein
MHFLIPGQQLTYSLPELWHLHRVWVALEQVANRVQLQHLAGSLDVERRWRWWALGLMEVSDGAFAQRRLNISVNIGKIKFGMDSSISEPNIFPWWNN